ncbi:MAG: DUF2231 domain-containing protein [Planctomycetota bacterium]|jgi:uncharacterized membrane protein
MTRFGPPHLRFLLLVSLLASAAGLVPAPGAAPALAAPALGQDHDEPHAHENDEPPDADNGSADVVDPDHDAVDTGHDHALDHGGGQGLDRLVHWLGKFHPVVVHMPIGLLIGAALAEVLLMITGASWLAGAARFGVMFGALTAATAAPLGWANAAGAEYAGELASALTVHRWLGTGAAAWAVATLALSEASRRERFFQWRPWYRVALLTGAALVGVTGHFGGTLVFGLEYYRW